MPRRIPENRIKELLESATRVFIAQGYRRAQMADVAAEMGVAKGTPYLYVESKEALFEAVMLSAGGQIPEPSELELPLTARPAEVLVEILLDALERGAVPPALRQAADRKRVADPRAELEAVVRELYRVSASNRTVIKLIDRCGADRPELAETFYRKGRLEQLAWLERYLTQRIASGQLRSVPHANVAARFVIETIATWAVHIHWDPAPQPIDPETAEDTVVHFVLGGLAQE